MLLTFYIKTFKILTCSVLILGLKLYRFGLFSKGFYCLLFNVLCCVPLLRTFAIILGSFLFVKHFFILLKNSLKFFLKKVEKSIDKLKKV